MIKVNSISIKFGTKTIFNDVSFLIKKGENAVICGESGSGKSTILKTLLGIHPSSGKIYIEEIELNPTNITEIRKKMVYIPQSISVFENDSVNNFLYQPFTFKNNKHITPDKNIILELFDRFNLKKGLLSQLTSRLSGGELQRISLIRALLLKKKILLLDEVSSGMDEKNRNNVIEYLFEDKEITTLSISHDSVWINRSDVKLQLNNSALEMTR